MTAAANTVAVSAVRPTTTAPEMEVSQVRRSCCALASAAAQLCLSLSDKQEINNTFQQLIAA